MLMRFDPFGEFDRLARDLAGTRRPAFMPVDASQEGDRFFLHIDLPGVDPDAIDLTVEKDVLTITAERSWQPSDDATVVMSERPQGTFTRRFLVGEGLDAEKIEAGYDHGVLTVTIPMAEQAKPRKISVGASDRALTA